MDPLRVFRATRFKRWFNDLDKLAPLALLPRSALGLIREMTRHVLRHPVVGVMAIAKDQEDRIVLIRRSDTGMWALPGGTLEWGETLREALMREVREETGASVTNIGPVVGVYSRPDRDPRFHAVSVVVWADVRVTELAPSNPMEIREVRAFHRDDIPSALSMGVEDMLYNAFKTQGAVVFE